MDQFKNDLLSLGRLKMADPKKATTFMDEQEASTYTTGQTLRAMEAILKAART